MRVIIPPTWSVVAVLSVATAVGAAAPVSRAATHVKGGSARTVPEQTDRLVAAAAPPRYIPFVESLSSVIPKRAATRSTPPATAIIELLIGTGTAGMGLALPAILAGIVVLGLALAVRRRGSEP